MALFLTPFGRFSIHNLDHGLGVYAYAMMCLFMGARINLWLQHKDSNRIFIFTYFLPGAETSRRLRLRRKRRQRWICGSIAAAITLGTGALAWSYLSTGGESSSTVKTVAPEHGSAAK